MSTSVVGQESRTQLSPRVDVNTRLDGMYYSAPSASRLRIKASYSNSACVRCLTTPLPADATAPAAAVDTVGAALTVTRTEPILAGRDTFDRAAVAAASLTVGRFFTNRFVGTNAGRGMTRGAALTGTEGMEGGGAAVAGVCVPTRPRFLFHASSAVSEFGSSGSISGGSACEDERGGGRVLRRAG